MIFGLPKKILLIGGVGVAVVVIYLAGLGKQTSDASSGSTGCRVTVTADVLNVRQEASQTSTIVGKYQRDAQIDVIPGVQNGFRKLADNKWASAEFLKPNSGANCG